MGQDRIGWGRTGLDGTGPDWMERARLDGTGLDWIGQGRVGLDADWAWLDWMGQSCIIWDNWPGCSMTGRDDNKIIFSNHLDCFVTT